MKARYLLTAIGLSLGIGAPSLIEAQNANQSTGQPTAKRDAKSAATTRQASPGLRRSGLPPSFFDQSEQVRRASLPYGFLDQNDGGGIRFTSSTMRSVTRAGILGVETGTFGSDVNGQIGTTNQNGMVYYPFSSAGVFIYHFDTGVESKPAPVRAHRSPKPKKNTK